MYPVLSDTVITCSSSLKEYCIPYCPKFNTFSIIVDICFILLIITELLLQPSIMETNNLICILINVFSARF